MVRYLGSTEPSKIQNTDFAYKLRIFESVFQHGELVGCLGALRIAVPTLHIQKLHGIVLPNYKQVSFEKMQITKGWCLT